jgi:signal transduction histidine kinase
MRTRLLSIVLSLVTLLVLGMGIPLALSVASSEQQTLFLDRLTDTGRYASLVQQPLIDDQPELVSDKLRRYAELYGIETVVLDRDGDPVAGSMPTSQPTDPPGRAGTPTVVPPFDLHDPMFNGAVTGALAGRHPTSGALLLPWETAPLVLAEPVLADGEVRGVVLTVSPTTEARVRVLIHWVIIALGGLLALGLAVLVALPVVRWILRPVRLLDDATGSLVTAVVSGRDFERIADERGPAELRHLTRSFHQMAASVSDALAAQRAFVADASHQLRNPLTALRLRLGNLDGQVDTEAVEHYTAALAETDRLKRILDDLLSMARSEGTGSELVAVDIGPVVRERVADWQVVAESRGIDLRVHGGDLSTKVLAPPKAVEAILDALLDNALKFTEPNSAVDVRLSGNDQLVTLAVRDHGPGLRAEELERATDRFWRSQTHQNVIGSGLGLAIVRRIAERAGGAVRLDLPDGGGLRVSADLPRAEPRRPD